MHRLDLHRSRPMRRAGFTIIELLAATAVLTVLILIVSQMVSSTSRTVGHDERRLESDGNARMVFDRMQMDLDGMPKRGDLDVSFVKNSGGDSNDSFFFYSQAPGSATTATNRNTLSLVGYAVDSEYHLDRYGKGLFWDGGTDTVNFLTFSSTTNFTPEGKSTIAGTFGTNLATVPLTSDGIPSDPWQVLSYSVFRMEVCFLLKDGKYSNYPGINVISAISSYPSSATGTAGTRMVVKDSNQGYNTYLCVRTGVSNDAVWQPIGLGDVQAVIVTLAMLDKKSRVLIKATDLQAAAAALKEPTDSDFSGTSPKLPAQTWQEAVNSGALSSLPKSIQGNVRIYQRAIYLNP
jgi:prepilin-type N-terminal cleavage/methylation domain-containing protein